MTHRPDYYNEVDPYAAQWLRNLIAAGEIPAGDVDERDIRDVRPADLDGYRRCHFFAGIGVWAKALDLSGWDETQRIWTGSCPCQPFSAAGQGLGFDDERHLWPDWHWLIEQCRPEIVLGEQVASADGLVWADLVSADMEATGYALGPVDTCAAGFRSYHIRQRLYFAAVDLVSAADAAAAQDAAIRRFGGLADAHDPRSQGRDREHVDPSRRQEATRHSGSRCFAFGLADTDGRNPGAERQQSGGQQRLQPEGCGGAQRLEHADDAGRGAGQWHDPGSRHRAPAAAAGGPDRMADAAPIGCGEERADARRRDAGDRAQGRTAGCDTGGDLGGLADMQGKRRDRRADTSGTRGRRGTENGRADVWTDPSDGYWRDADWLFCRDGVWRPVGPGTFPLAHAAPSRLGRLRAYGNALDLAQATGFVRAVMERDMGNGQAADLFEWGA